MQHRRWRNLKHSKTYRAYATRIRDDKKFLTLADRALYTVSCSETRCILMLHMIMRYRLQARDLTSPQRKTSSWGFETERLEDLFGLS
jgi:hypothetical protein